MTIPLRTAMIAGLNEWAAKYPGAADCLFCDPESYADDLENAKADIAHHEGGNPHLRMSDHEADDAYYLVNADEARIKMVREIKARFQLKAAE